MLACHEGEQDDVLCRTRRLVEETSICIVDETGKILREATVASEPGAIAKFLKSNAHSAIRIGLETGATSIWLTTELRALGYPVICIDARHAKAVLKMQINKSDRNDAAGIARIMQTGCVQRGSSRASIVMPLAHCGPTRMQPRVRQSCERWAWRR